MLSLEKEKNRSVEKITYPIDFVVTWVDASDPEWLSQKEKYHTELSHSEKKDNSSFRYREWGMFRYWFRAVEQYAPWVRYVWLVTCGHTPEWLNTEHPKLRVVRHEDFIPKEYLPTFSSIYIELNLWRISGLSEHFVYFNDDMYLFDNASAGDFFTGNLPNLCGVTMPLYAHPEMSSYEHEILNDIGLCNSVCRIRDVMTDAPEKWFSYKYGENTIYNHMTYIVGYLSGIIFSHLPLPMRKSSMEQCHEAFEESFRRTCMNKFRSMENINQQIFFMWEICHNTFEPVSMEHYGFACNISKENMVGIREAFRKGARILSVCLNDSEKASDVDYEDLKRDVTELMNKKFPSRSSYEK